MEISNKKGVQHIVSTLAGLGVTEVILCPGSRNAPFIISFSRHTAFHCTSIRDERSAAFFALGKAIELKQPVVLVSTSGSAVLNFAPAIAEAYYQRIPLIVLTTDRAKEWVHQGDGQTMNQENVFQNIIRKSYTLDAELDSVDALWYHRRSVSEAYHTALYSDKGPVHINVRLSEPLYETEELTTDPGRFFQEEIVQKRLNPATRSKFAQQFNQSKKVMILVGQHPVSEALNRHLARMAGFDNVIVLYESTSNLRSELFIQQIDRCISFLAENDVKSLMPDLLITLGGAVISKRIKQFLRQHPATYHWNIHPYDAYIDTYQSLTTAVSLDAVDFLEEVEEDLQSSPATYRQEWKALERTRRKAHEAFVHTGVYSDLLVFDHIYQHLPSLTHLHLGNSSVIRYAQLFDNHKLAASWSNRGMSGIDGSTSTAMGAAAASEHKNFVLITGDMSFHYDKNAFWNEEQIENLKVIIINNGGGNIFKIIPGPDTIAETPQFLEAKMTDTGQYVAEMHRWDYATILNETELDEGLRAFFAKEGKAILEIFTDAAVSPAVLNEYWKYIQSQN